MKTSKTSKIIEICIWVCVLMSLISGMLYFTDGHNWLFYNNRAKVSIELGNLKEVKRESESINGIEKINLKMLDADIKIECVDGDKIEVIEYSNESDKDKVFKMTKSGETLNFERKGKNMDEMFKFSTKSHRIEVKLPENFNRELIIENTSGDVFVEDELNLNTLNLSTSSGDINLGKVEAKSNIGATSGNVYVEKLEGESHNVGATSGNINIEEEEGDICLGTTSGNIFVKSMDGASHDIGATSGNITLKDVKGDLEIGTTSGKIIIDKVKGDEHNLTSTSGDISINDGSGDFNITTTSGDVILGEVNGSNHEIHTSSGDIDIKKGRGTFMTDTNSGDIRKGNIED